MLIALGQPNCFQALLNPASQIDFPVAFVISHYFYIRVYYSSNMHVILILQAMGHTVPTGLALRMGGLQDVQVNILLLQLLTKVNNLLYAAGVKLKT